MPPTAFGVRKAQNWTWSKWLQAVQIKSPNIHLSSLAKQYGPIFPKYIGLGVTLADFAVVFKPCVRRVCCGGGFAVLAGVLAKISGDLYSFGRVQDTVVEPHFSRFRCAGRHAGLDGGLRARMAARICAKMRPVTATSPLVDNQQ
jgi:hypothetical protein